MGDGGAGNAASLSTFETADSSGSGACALCHSNPTDSVGNDVSDGFLDPAQPLHAAGLDRVSCTLCQQLQAGNPRTPASFIGNYTIDTSSWPPLKPASSPYAEPFTHPMEMHSGFSPHPGSQMAQSAQCGSCPILFTPTVDAQGNQASDGPTAPGGLRPPPRRRGSGGQALRAVPAGPGVPITSCLWTAKWAFPASREAATITGT